MYVCVPAHVFVTWTFVCIWCLDMGGAGWIVALNMSSFAGAIWHFRAHDVSSDDRNFLRWAEESRRCNKHQQAHIMRSSLNRVFCISRLLSALAGFNHVQRPSTSSVAQNSLPTNQGKLMMAAAMWTKPHVIAFDEPTNYLDFQPSGSRSRVPVQRNIVSFVSWFAYRGRWMHSRRRSNCLRVALSL